MSGQSSHYKGIESAILGQCTKVTVKLSEKSLPEFSAVEPQSRTSRQGTDPE